MNDVHDADVKTPAVSTESSKVETNRVAVGGMRLMAFDLLKLFAIFLVIYGHSIQHLLSSHYSDEPVYRYIYSFHMPLFMMVSGFFSVSSMRQSFIPFLSKKFRQLILPCLTWGLLLWYSCHLALWIFRGLSFSPFAFWGYLFYDWWFLKSCFLCYLLAWLGEHSRLSKPVWILLTLMLSSFVSTFYFKLMYPGFVVGMLLRTNDNLFRWLVRRWYVPAIVFAAMSFFWDKSFWEHSFSMRDTIKGLLVGGVLVTDGLYYDVYRLLIGIVGSLSFIGLFNRVFTGSPATPFARVCSDWGGYTLSIYILQSIILEIGLGFLLKLDGLGFVAFNFVVAPAISFLVLVFCVLIAKQIERSRVAAYLLMGKPLGATRR